MGQYKHRQRGGGCLLILVALGIGAGFLLFQDTPFAPEPTTSAGQVMNDLGTLNAVMADASSSGVGSLTADEQPDVETRRLYLPDAITGSLIEDIPRTNNSWDISRLQNTVGHLEGTAWLGDSGNTILVANYEDALEQPDVFYYLAEIRVGDQIIIEDGSFDNRTVYVVVDVFTTTPDDDSILNDTDAPRLTLIASDSWNTNRDNPIDPIVVVAEPTS